MGKGGREIERGRERKRERDRASCVQSLEAYGVGLLMGRGPDEEAIGMIWNCMQRPLIVAGAV